MSFTRQIMALALILISRSDVRAERAREFEDSRKFGRFREGVGEGGGMKANELEVEENDNLKQSTSASCFPSNAIVIMRDFKAENIANVTVGDFILTSSGFSQVFAFTHNDPIPSAKYLRISTEGTGEPLEVSEEHIIFKDQNGRRVPVQAREIREGDVVYVVTNSNKEGTIVRTIHWESTLSEGEMPLFRALKVVEIDQILRKGLHCPITFSGTIIVQGFLASTFGGVRTITYNGHVVSDAHATSMALVTPFKIVYELFRNLGIAFFLDSNSSFSTCYKFFSERFQFVKRVYDQESELDKASLYQFFILASFLITVYILANLHYLAAIYLLLWTIRTLANGHEFFKHTSPNPMGSSAAKLGISV